MEEEIKPVVEVTSKEKKSEYVLVNIPTQHSLAVQTPTEEIISTEQTLVLILNKLTKVESMLG